MMMFRLIAGLILAFGFVAASLSAARTAPLPAEVQGALKDYLSSADCKKMAGAPSVKKGALVLSDTRLDYFLINLENVTCDGHQWFCGATGNCSQLVFATDDLSAGYNLVFDDSILGLELKIVREKFVLLVHHKSIDCDQEPGTECVKTWNWVNGKFEESP
jgi:hypothetical protein